MRVLRYCPKAFPAAWLLAAMLVLAAQTAGPATAKTMTETYDGLTLMAVTPTPGRTFDIDILSPEAGIKRLRKALDLVMARSPHGRSGIERLKDFGSIFIVYNPNFPKPSQDISTIRRAAFIPTFLDDDETHTGVKFPVIVSRHGINAPIEYLAAVLVHELVGHGIQQAEGRATTTRVRELECEGWLQEEWAYQEFGVDKSSRDMIDFRRQLEGSAMPTGQASFRRRSFLQGQAGFGTSRDGQCSPFKRYLAEHAPEKLDYFNKLNPDVPQLLAALRDYVKYLDDTGMTTAALDARDTFRGEHLNEILKSGSPDQQYRIALALKSGQGMPQDDRLAAQFFEKAASQGHVEAEYRIALAYSQGDGVNGDPGRAAHWYAKAAENDHAAAQRDLGRLYEFGRGVTRDLKMAAKWYRAAAENGDATGQNNYAVFLLTGRGEVEKDPEGAAKLFERSANQDFAPATLNLARLYVSGLGVERDQAKAAVLFATAADDGDPEAQFELAKLYLNGRGVDRDAKKAEELLSAAAKQGHELSQTMLARMYTRGLGVEKNAAHAAALLRDAADQGNVEAQGLLAAALAAGNGVEKDLEAAYFWATLAARQPGRTQLFARNIQHNLEKALSTAQIQAAEAKIKGWRPSNK